MKKCTAALVTATGIFVLLMFVNSTRAADANQPKAAPRETQKDKQMVVKGTVSVLKDKDGKVTEVKLEDEKNLVYRITLNAKGKELGKKMAGKTVKVIGTSEVKDNVKWLTVKKYEAVVVKPESKPKQPKKPDSNK